MVAGLFIETGAIFMLGPMDFNTGVRRRFDDVQPFVPQATRASFRAPGLDAVLCFQPSRWRGTKLLARVAIGPAGKADRLGNTCWFVNVDKNSKPLDVLAEQITVVAKFW